MKSSSAAGTYLDVGSSLIRGTASLVGAFGGLVKGRRQEQQGVPILDVRHK